MSLITTARERFPKRFHELRGINNSQPPNEDLQLDIICLDDTQTRQKYIVCNGYPFEYPTQPK